MSMFVMVRALWLLVTKGWLSFVKVSVRTRIFSLQFPKGSIFIKSIESRSIILFATNDPLLFCTMDNYGHIWQYHNTLIANKGTLDAEQWFSAPWWLLSSGIIGKTPVWQISGKMSWWYQHCWHINSGVHLSLNLAGQLQKVLVCCFWFCFGNILICYQLVHTGIPSTNRVFALLFGHISQCYLVKDLKGIQTGCNVHVFILLY